MLSNAYFLAKFRFDTAENEPAKNLKNLLILLTLTPLTLTLRGGNTISTGARRSAWDGRRRRPENGDDGDLWIDELAARSGNSICVEFWIEFAYNTTSEDM